MKGSKKHANWDSRIPARDEGYVHVVRVPWTGQASYWWNDACADIMEVFGLPGNRFTSHPTADYMDFYFKTEKDKQLCQILLSEKI
jgi:hypothetical protein